MSNHNDTVFAKFMVALSGKIIARQDARAAAHEQLRLDLEAQNQQYTQQFNALQSKTGHLLSASQIAVQQAGLQYTAHMMSATRGIHSGGTTISQNDITADEMEVIRAYHAGEDVLTVILSQERL